jgi:AP-4 complex subunit epsilon-1
MEHMIRYMRTLDDAHNKTKLAGRIIELAECSVLSNQWFIQVFATIH